PRTPILTSWRFSAAASNGRRASDDRHTLTCASWVLPVRERWCSTTKRCNPPSVENAVRPMKPTLMSWLQLRPEFHKTIRALRLVEIASKVLELRPLKRTLPNGSRYRVRYGESLLMADEIFKRQVYRDPFEGRQVKTFIDLGSNVGYFTCYAADRIGGDA